MRNLPTAKAFAATALSAAALLATAGPAAATTCDTVAATTGSSTGAGTEADPLKTAQQALDALAPGGTACLRAGSYGADEEIRLQIPNTTLTSFPGERATLRGRVYITKEGDGVTISELDLDGRNASDLPSPSINSTGAVLRNNDITNYHTTICVHLGSPDTWGRAIDTLIEGNRIHDCGTLPSTNKDHGIYVNSSDNAVIRNNWIYDNADRGIQLYPDAQNTLVTGNVIDGNGEGVIFSGEGNTASSNNIVENNIITNAKLRDNVESYWGGDRIGSGNVVRDNCVGGGVNDDGDGGILEGSPSEVGFAARDNVLSTANFADPAADDFTVDPGSECGQILAGAPAPPAAGDDTTADTPPRKGSRKPTLRFSTRNLRKDRNVRVRGLAEEGAKVLIVQRRNGNWRKLATATSADGSYTTRIRAQGKGREVIKAVSVGGSSSRPVAVRVKK